ncbi:biotin-dependent carboxyltransferase family protein [Urechidicola vernalis]|uniref:Biotin-dependent carboxyltransferase family protein n=1 Tax=Urechidicola vernalis TaxID=3075600 RepID=A0ABU2Y1N1_9FLAO|nr:biotin-dependent carboxyltransferase family protein [Urechidicola sp. P050]MDT0551922.1 biotin-dependent carboxyltransferase family protein [Urechidicola sp. P050]
MIKVISPGFYTSIQDLGRIGFRNQGVPTSGCMDSVSANLANILVNNTNECALLEITMLGPKLQFLQSYAIAIVGAYMQPKLNGKVVTNNCLIQVNTNDVLSFGKLKKGVRAYLAIGGGIDSSKILNSRSQFYPITKNAKIEKNDLLTVQVNRNPINQLMNASVANKVDFYDKNKIQVSKGPDFEIFEKEDFAQLFNKKFSVSNNNDRMGYQLNELLFRHRESLITSPVIPGTVQFLPNGKLVVLMKDGQTTGGYPRILQLTELSIAILAQKKVGDEFSFELTPTINLT